MKYDELECLAKAAIPGPWQTEGGMNLYVFTAGNEKMIAEARGTGAGFSDEQQSDNAKYIAAANPEAVLALLAERRRMVERLQQWTGPHPDHHVANGFCEYCWRSEHARALLRELGEL